jgi:hypothetical protein
MKQARFFSLFVFVVMMVYGMVGFYCLPLASFDGDLTRIGKLPESLFGWTKDQPAIDPALLQQASWEDADVLVIGDSFSAPRIWQTILTRQGYKVRTEPWGSTQAICGEFTQWLKNKGFKGRYVVIEMVERNVDATLAKSLGCIKMAMLSFENQVGPPPTHIDRSKANYSGRLSVGIQVWINRMRLERWGERDFGVKVEQVSNGCKLFSHPRCNDALFFFGDHIPDFGPDTLANMETINNRLHGIIPVWVIVPDKSTAYLHPDKKFWDDAERRLTAPNVLKVFRKAINDDTVDLYKGDDTHLSTSGFLLLGNTIYQSMRQATPHK